MEQRIRLLWSDSLQRILLLLCLYIVQGLSIGFQSKALKVLLRKNGTSLRSLGFVGILTAPWLLKVLWSPFVDTYYSEKFGRRKTWIVPCLIGLSATMMLASKNTSIDDMPVLMVLVLIMNLFASTSDIATDGFAVDILSKNELGEGNTAQIVGFKIGMLLGGGVFIYLSDYIGWSGMFVSMAAFVGFVLALILVIDENAMSKKNVTTTEEKRKTNTTVINDRQVPTHVEQSIYQTCHLTLTQLKSSGSIWMILLLLTYKTGEVLVDSMFVPFLVDAGYSNSMIGLWSGVYGMAASISGSLVGCVLYQKIGILRALAITSALRVVPMSLKMLGTIFSSYDALVKSSILMESFTGGTLTTCMFTYMMSTVTDKSVGATYYTVMSTLEMIGKSVPALISGFLVEIFGYTNTFLLAIIITAAQCLVFVPLFRINNRIIMEKEKYN